MNQRKAALVTRKAGVEVRRGHTGPAGSFVAVSCESEWL